ncbi:MAG: hypothetical protein ACREP5_14180 [Candidatus Binatia bacterium]
MSAILPTEKPWISGVANVFRLLFKEQGNVALAKSPLLTFFKGGQDILAGEFIDRIRAHVQNNGDLFAVKQLLFPVQHMRPPEEIPLGEKVRSI